MSPRSIERLAEALSRTRAARALDAGRALCPDDRAFAAYQCARCDSVLAPEPLAFPWDARASRTRPVLLAAVTGALREALSIAAPEARACRCATPDRGSQRPAAARWYHRAVSAASDVVLEVYASGEVRALLAPLQGPERLVAESAHDARLGEALGAPLHMAVVWGELCASASDGRAQCLPVEPGAWLLAGAPSVDDALRALRRRPEAPGDLVVARADDVAAWSGAWAAASPEVFEAVRARALSPAVAVSRAELVARLAAALAWHGLALDADDEARGALVVRGARFSWPLDADALAAEMLGHAWGLSELVAVAADVAAARVARLERFVTALQRARPAVTFESNGAALTPVRPDGTRGRAVDLALAALTIEPGTEVFERSVRYWCDRAPAWAPAHRVCVCGAPASLSARLVDAAGLARLAERPVVLREFRAEGGATLAAAVLVARCDLHVEPLTGEACAAIADDPERLAERLARDRHDEVFALSWELVRDAEGREALAAWGAAAATTFLEDGWLAALLARAGATLASDEAPIAHAVTPDTVFVHAAGFDAEALAQLVAATTARRGWSPDDALPFALQRPVRLDARPMGAVVRA